MSYQSVNPCHGKVLKAFEELSDQQLERSIETAATCFIVLENADFDKTVEWAVWAKMTSSS